MDYLTICTQRNKMLNYWLVYDDDTIFIYLFVVITIII
jgi:hypothetical protein